MKKQTKALVAVKTQEPIETSIEAVGKLLATLERYEVPAALKTEHEVVVVDELLGTAKKAIDTIEADRKSFVDPLNKTVKRINERYKPLRETAEGHVRVFKDLIVGYQETLRQLELKKAEKLAVKAEKQGAVELAEDLRNQALTKPVGPTLAGVTTVTYYSAKVTDFALLPDEYKKVDEAKLNGVARALKDGFKVPGAELVKVNDIRKGSAE